VRPADIKYLVVSHTHPDHIGNVELFPQAMLLTSGPARSASGASSRNIR
jgi:glyoxylase-like metal-dependent hydrolase (beta-lactamase superfamily II)